MNLAFVRFCPPIMALCLAGCAGQVATRTGVDGPAIPVNAPVMVVALPSGMENSTTIAQTMVMQALTRQGHAVSADAGLHVEIAMAERIAPVSVNDLTGNAISPSRKRQFLRSCAYRIQRLTIAVYSIKQPGVTRVWAEEQHCKAGLNDIIPALADRAVALLTKPELAGRTKRTGKN